MYFFLFICAICANWPTKENKFVIDDQVNQAVKKINKCEKCADILVARTKLLTLFLSQKHNTVMHFCC